MQEILVNETSVTAENWPQKKTLFNMVTMSKMTSKKS